MLNFKEKLTLVIVTPIHSRIKLLLARRTCTLIPTILGGALRFAIFEFYKKFQ